MSNGLFYNITDHLNSANLSIDSVGNVVEKIDYLPFGAERVNVGTGAFTATHTFTDQEKDTESGLLYFGARYYNPTIARFTQPDPVVLDPTRGEFQVILFAPQLQNAYSYTANNPLKYVDEEGEFIATLAILAVVYAPVWVPIAVTTVASIGAAISAYHLGAAIGYYTEGDYERSNESIAKEMMTLEATVAVISGAMAVNAITQTPTTPLKKQPARFITNTKVKSHGKVIGEGTVDLKPTLDRIKAGGTHPHKHDGTTYRNTPNEVTGKRLLPQQQDPKYYTEYVHPTPGLNKVGPQRIIKGGGGELYYSPDHYETVIPLN